MHCLPLTCNSDQVFNRNTIESQQEVFCAITLNKELFQYNLFDKDENKNSSFTPSNGTAYPKTNFPVMFDLQTNFNISISYRIEW